MKNLKKDVIFLWSIILAIMIAQDVAAQGNRIPAGRYRGVISGQITGSGSANGGSGQGYGLETGEMTVVVHEDGSVTGSYSIYFEINGFGRGRGHYGSREIRIYETGLIEGTNVNFGLKRENARVYGRVEDDGEVDRYSHMMALNDNGFIHLKGDKNQCGEWNGNFDGKFKGLANAAKRARLQVTYVEKFYIFKPGARLSREERREITLNDFPNLSQWNRNIRQHMAVIRQTSILLNPNSKYTRLSDGFSVDDNASTISVQEATDRTVQAMYELNKILSGFRSKCNDELNQEYVLLRNSVLSDLKVIAQDIAERIRTIDDFKNLTEILTRSRSFGDMGQEEMSILQSAVSKFDSRHGVGDEVINIVESLGYREWADVLRRGQR